MLPLGHLSVSSITIICELQPVIIQDVVLMEYVAKYRRQGQDIR